MNQKMDVRSINREEILRAQYALCNVLDRQDELLKEKMLEFITHSYFNLMIEIDKDRLPDRARMDRPRIDYFLNSLFYFIFEKMHKGDRLRAYEILKELKITVVSMR